MNYSLEDLVALAVSDGENIGRWRTERDPAETIELRQIAIKGRLAQIEALFAERAGARERRMVAAMEELRKMGPTTLYGTRDRYTGELSAHEAYYASEVLEVIEDALRIPV